MENPKKRVARHYSKEYKVEAVKLARQIGGKKAAAELGIPDGTLSSWIHDARRGAIDTGPGTQTPQSGLTQASEIERLKAENKTMAKDNKRLREENAFLEEASAFFAASRQRLAKKSDSNT
jgi:transposase